MDIDEDDFGQDEADSVSIEDMMNMYDGADDTAVMNTESSSKAFDNSGYQSNINGIIRIKVAEENVFIHKLIWVGGRIEIVLAVNDVDPETSVNRETGVEENAEGPGVDILESVHRQIYEEMELREEELDFVNRFELMIASPGVSDCLRNDRDFVSFKGFVVTVSTTEEFKKRLQFEGSLIERSDEHVVVSLKGRIVKVPRELVKSVRLPKARYESGDSEMRKLR